MKKIFQTGENYYKNADIARKKSEKVENQSNKENKIDNALLSKEVQSTGNEWII